MTARITGWLLLAALVPAAKAQGGVVSGVVRSSTTIHAGPAARSAYPGSVHSLPNAAPTARGLLSDAVISVDRIPASVDSAIALPASSPRLAQKNQSFVPHVLPVAAGTTVEFPNLDPIFHNVFSVSPVRRFDLGKYPRGHSRSVRFDRTGLVQVYCDIHSNMAAFIVVLPNRAFAQPDAAGRYSLPDLPAGEYVVNAWHPDFRPLRRSVQVPESGDVELDLVFAGPRAGPAASPPGEEGR